MKVNSTKVNSANGIINATISNATIDKKKDEISKKMAKEIKLDGFRKGKVPASVVKARYKEQITQDAQNEIIQNAYNTGIEGFGDLEVIGNVKFSKFDTDENGVSVEFKVGLKPKIELGDYDKLVDDFTIEEVTDEEIEDVLKTVAKNMTEPTKIKRKRALRSGDIAIFDFEGYVDDKLVESATSKDYSLEIGSGRFISGFEDGMIGMKYDETRELNLKFPDDYHAQDLKGKDVLFKVTLKEIKEQVLPEFDDDFAKKIIPEDKEITIEKLKNDIRENLKNGKKAKLYNNELKPKLLEALIKNIDFELPENIIEDELNMLINNKLASMKQEEAQEYANNIEKLEELKKEFENEAKDRVKTTLIIDELAHKEGINVEDSEVTRTLYYEAIQTRQDPSKILEYYEKNNLLPVVKMSIIEDKVLTKILDRKAQKEGSKE